MVVESSHESNRLPDSSTLIRVRLRITGKVQGVYYRQNLKSIAKRKNICGWVRNLSDGSVEAVLEGSKLSIENIVSWSSNGPDGANVSSVTVTREPYEGDFSSFEITYD